jgi:hypothetical protein
VACDELAELRSIAEKLRGFETEISSIQAMIPQGSGGRLLGEQQHKAQTRLRELKKELREEAHRRDFSALEKIWYERAISLVAAELTLRTTSVPDHLWFGKLSQAKLTLTFTISGIEDKLAAIEKP